MGTENLDKIFNPKRIAVIGASDREDSLGAKVLRNLIGVGYKGVVYPVNSFRSTVQGIAAYPSVKKIPWKIDLAIIVTPAHTAPQIVRECGESGVSGIIIMSAGFREAGAEGEALEKEILAIKDQYNMRIIGAQSLGVIRPKIGLNATFAHKTVPPGKIAFISQSAALCASVLDWASEAHIGVSGVVSTGSMIDVDLGDLIDYFGSDAQTRSIVLYIECVKDARKFMSAARGFARAKPIVVVKAGRFPESAEAAISHTGALCGEDAVHDAAFRRAGIVRVEAISDLFSCAETLAKQPNPKGPNLTIITNAGGPGIMATDALIARGGRLSRLSSETIDALKSVLPSYCRVTNPIDILEEATLDRFRKVIEICFKDPNSDGFLIIYTPQGVADPLATAEMIVELSKQTTKTLLVSLICEGVCSNARQILTQNSIPAFTTPEESISAFMNMYHYTENLELLYQTPEELSVEVSIPTFLKGILKNAFSEGLTVLSASDSLRFLEAYKIPTIRTLVAKTPKEAEVMASELGFPVVMKAQSPQITHKSRAQGVILNVWSPSEIEPFFTRLSAAVRSYDPNAEFQGVAIQPMFRGRGSELLIGSKKDAQFGSVIVFGRGGVATELLKDTSIGLPPLNQVLARRLMERTDIYKSLVSGEHPSNVKLLEEILIKFSQLVTDFPEIKEIDINPLIISGNEAVAVDARIVIDQERILHGARPHEHLVIAPYPRKYVSQWQLKNGASVTLRPIKPEDETLLSELYESLSDETLKFRFFQISNDFSHEVLTRYCNIDYDREIVIVAETQNDQRRIIGVVLLMLEPGGKRGEFAVVVGDQWQGQGLGSKLMDYIVEIGKDMGLKAIYGYSISDNTRMISLCKRKGYKLEPADEELVKATLDIA